MRIWTLLIVAALTVGCDKSDEFDKVEPVTAPESEGKAKPVEKTDEMPSDHPPVADNSGSAPAAKPQAVGFSDPSEYGKTGPLRWETPESWTAAKPASRMRLAEYVVPGEGEPATITVFYFGPQGGGGVEANVKRWVGQFEGGEPKRETTTVNGMKVHTVDVSGTYSAGMAGGNQPPKEGQRMLGAIVESPAGLFFFKMVGPEAVVAANEKGWNTFVQSFSEG